MIEEFLLIGIIILVGFFSLTIFERTKLPDVLLLLLFGAVIGPLTGVIQPAQFIGLAPFVGTLALIMVLLEGGLNLSLSKVVKRLPQASLFSVAVFILGTVLSGAALHFFLNWNLLDALFLGVVVGGSSSTIVMPILAQLSAGEEVKTLLSLESVITDVLCIVVALALLEIISSNAVDYSSAAQSIASAFTTAIVVGILFGLFWVKVLQKFQGKSLGYVVTLAVVFILYAFNEAIGGSGAIAVLVFGLVLGNSVELAELLKWKGEFQIDASIKKMQTEIAFFVRTFFFVYLGIIFNTNAFGGQVIILVGLLLLALFAGRAIIVRALGQANAVMKKYSVLLMTMAPRGLAAAVLAFIPSNMGVEIPFVVEAAFLIILLTNILATIGAFYYEQNHGRAPSTDSTPSKSKSKPRIVQ